VVVVTTAFLALPVGTIRPVTTVVVVATTIDTNPADLVDFNLANLPVRTGIVVATATLTSVLETGEARGALIVPATPGLAKLVQAQQTLLALIVAAAPAHTIRFDTNAAVAAGQVVAATRVTTAVLVVRIGAAMLVVGTALDAGPLVAVTVQAIPILIAG